ncbi:MAG: PEP-CTERM sorting domain-containing protein [Bryobacterales bacterium]|nr:PEP-CTERM sorting domain-containing protein [Bryobacterales bacterium]
MKFPVLPYVAIALFTTTAHASVIYTFTATTRASFGSPSHQETFRLETPGFIPLVTNGPLISLLETDPAVTKCTPCKDAPVPALHFLRGSTSDLIQFADEDGATRLFTFPFESLSNAGSYSTLWGINVERGELTVANTPEPSTFALLATGAALLAFRRQRRNPAISPH